MRLLQIAPRIGDFGRGAVVGEDAHYILQHLRGAGQVFAGRRAHHDAAPVADLRVAGAVFTEVLEIVVLRLARIIQRQWLGCGQRLVEAGFQMRMLLLRDRTVKLITATDRRILRDLVGERLHLARPHRIGLHRRVGHGGDEVRQPGEQCVIAVRYIDWTRADDRRRGRLIRQLLESGRESGECISIRMTASASIRVKSDFGQAPAWRQ
jgi:hypothetical protein